MASFNYKALDKFGRVTRGKLDALNEVDLEARLERMGLDLVTFGTASNYSFSLFSRKRVQYQDLILFCFQMEQLTRAGIPLLESLSEIHSHVDNLYFKEVLGIVITEVEGGKTFSAALTQHPNVFDSIFTSLIDTGEKTGQLPLVFENLFLTLRWYNDIVSQTKKLIIYPIFVIVVVLGVVVFLMSYLVPQMVPFLQSIGQELPLQTRLLIAVSHVFIDYGWLMLIGILASIFVIRIAIQSSAKLRYWADLFLLNLPVTGQILNKIIMARFTRYFALMYQTGISVLDSIKMSQQIVSSQPIANRLEQIYNQVASGGTLSESFGASHLFPTLIVRMIKIGESTGELDKSLLNISAFYDKDARDAIDKMLALIEPTLTIVLGGILAFIMFSVLGPVYDSLSKLSF